MIGAVCTGYDALRRFGLDAECKLRYATRLRLSCGRVGARDDATGI